MSTNKTITIYGPTSPRGKALKQLLPETLFKNWKLQLLDEQELEGTLTEYDGGVELVKKTTMDSLQSADIIFFADRFEIAQEYIHILEREEPKLPRLIIDLSAGIEGGNETGVFCRLTHADSVLKETTIVRLANPLATGLYEILSICGALSRLSSVQATALVPVSETGKTGIDALHGQVVELMNFSSTPESLFGGQLIFNMLPGFGQRGSRLGFSEYERKVAAQTTYLLDRQDLPLSIVSTLVPTFYSFAVSLSLRFDTPVDVSRLASALSHSDGIEMDLNDLGMDQAFDGPLSSTDSADIHVIRCMQNEADPSAVQLWCHFDNIGATSIKHAIEIAESYFKAN